MLISLWDVEGMLVPNATVVLTSLGLSVAAGCTTPTPPYQQLSNVWGERVFPSTNMASVYPPRGGFFPGDVYALCEDKIEAGLTDLARTPVPPSNKNIESNKAADSKHHNGFEGIFLDRLTTFYPKMLHDFEAVPKFKTGADVSTQLMVLTFSNSKSVSLPVVAIPTSAFVATSRNNASASGLFGLIKAGLGVSRSHDDYYTLGVPRGNYSAISYTAAAAAVDEGLKDGVGERIQNAFNSVLKIQDPGCKINLYVAWKIYYATEVAYSWGETLAQAWAVQAQVVPRTPVQVGQQKPEVVAPSSVPAQGTVAAQGAAAGGAPAQPSPGGTTPGSISGATPQSPGNPHASEVLKSAVDANVTTATTASNASGERLAAGSASGFTSGVAFKYNYPEPVAISVAFLKLNFVDGKLISILPVQSKPGSTVQPMIANTL